MDLRQHRLQFLQIAVPRAHYGYCVGIGTWNAHGLKIAFETVRWNAPPVAEHSVMIKPVQHGQTRREPYKQWRNERVTKKNSQALAVRGPGIHWIDQDQTPNTIRRHSGNHY